MRKILFLLFFLFLFTISIFSSNLNDYLFNFDYLNPQSIQTKNETLTLKKLLYTKNSSNTRFNESIYFENLLLKPEEKDLFQIILNSSSFEYIKPFESLKVLKNNNPNSAIIKAIFIEYAYRIWHFDKNIVLKEEIINELNEINLLIGENPFTKFYKLKFLFTENPRDIFLTKDFESLVFDYPKNQRSFDLFISYLNINRNNDYTFQIYSDYLKFENKNIFSELFLASSFAEMGIEDIATKISGNVINSTSNPIILSKSYEILGDFAQFPADKILYYSSSILYIPATSYSNRLAKASAGIFFYYDFPVNIDYANIYAKLGYLFYNLDEKKYETNIRLLFNYANELNPYNNEYKNMVWKMRRKVIFKNFFLFMVPISILTIIGIFLVIKRERYCKYRDKGYFEVNKKEIKYF